MINNFLDIINALFFIWNNVSESGLCLRPQVKILLSWAQSIDVLPISGHQNKRKQDMFAGVLIISLYFLIFIL
jgi:hypothetical protein